ncbi:lectin like domain-containing protein [Methanolobus bombayensis]|uniref:lectin like domain-containing protein n=1 Tax=Methanolobus bombayensis TaxID=38023 RepID=UPI001AE512B4|nr:lectin like domain-containing protein [Methanolobus bombayensis]MBP1910107.1 PGF-pre-PGF domain-containing protein [Methanolobus bombayensis]
MKKQINYFVISLMFCLIMFFTIIPVISVSAADIDSKYELNSRESLNSWQLSTAPLNPEFIQYQDSLIRTQNESGTDDMITLSGLILPDSQSSFSLSKENVDSDIFTPSTGFVPYPIDFSYLSPVGMDMVMTEVNSDFSPSGITLYGSEALIPSSYDLREEGGVTSVKDQGFAGSCWTFSTLGSLESYLIHNRSETRDFSENHMKNTLLISNENGFDSSSPDAGGNNMMALAYLARWDGPIMESDDPYDDLSPVSPSDAITAKHVQETFIFPFVNYSSNISKLMMMEYGAIGIAIHSDESRFFNEANNTYYCYDEDAVITHAVTLVGWDDNFNRKKFTPAAPGNGAYIVKNSWGENWGEDGYFYVSYYDTSIGTSSDSIYKNYNINFLFTADNVSNYDRIYQYDPLGWCKSVGDNDTSLTGANVFTADSNETLEAVSFYAVDSNTSYNISIYLDPENGPVNSSGPVSVKNGSIPVAGYHTVELDSNVTLSAGQKFSVLINFTTPDFNYPIAVEKPVYGYSSNNFHSGSGESYASSDGVNWIDISASDMNICIKAFTKENKIPEAAFVADRRYVHVNESVNFSDVSLFSPVSWEWDFGDDSTSTLQDPSHSYSTPGNYNVTLNASNSFGNNISTRTSFIQVLNTSLTVNSSGTAEFTLIQDAIDAASEGDTIVIEPGIYNERIRVRKDNITIRSSTNDPDDVTVISSDTDKADPSNYAFFLWANNATIQNITVSGGHYGIYLLYANECNVIGCRITDNYLSGLIMQGTYNSSFLNCTIDNNTLSGLYVEYSGNNYFSNNSISGSRYNCLLESHTNVIDTSNTIDGKPIYYLSGVSDIVIDKDSNAGKIFLVDCSNITIEGIEVKNTYFGIRLYNTTISKINNCTSIDNGYGIYMTDSEGNEVSNSTLNDNNNYGIFLSGCSDNLIYNNYFNNSNNAYVSGGVSNKWNITKTSDTNIINRSYLGGNFWAKPDGTGWSQTEYSIGNGFCTAYEIIDDGNNTDNLPLTLNDVQPAVLDISSSHEDDNDGIRLKIATTTSSPANIVATDSSVRFVGKDAEVEYVFTDGSTPVNEISFESDINEGYVMATVSLLDELPETSPAPASVTVYKGMEIILGDEEFSSGIGDAKISFSVSKEWLESNGFGEGNVHMEHFSDGIWNKLPIVVTGEDDEYFYFEATTTGFSPFIICVDISGENPVNAGSSSGNVADGPVFEKTVSDVPLDSESSGEGPFNSLVAFSGLIIVTILALVCRTKKSK